MSGPPDISSLLEIDPHLSGFQDRLTNVYTHLQNLKQRLLEDCKSVDQLVQSYQEFGVFELENGNLRFKEWAPNLTEITLAGDFNDWKRDEHKFTSKGNGLWELEVPKETIHHGSDLRYFCVDKQGKHFDRISPWARYVTCKDRIYYNMEYYGSEFQFEWNYRKPATPRALRIYEAHVGIASPEPKVSSYLEFADSVIPRIARLGYNTIQLMAIMEHAYYASFGYQVTSFFAPSSRFGTPDTLKYLIDTAHKHGLIVLLDLVHSHASQNTVDGLNQFDGSDGHYFLSGPAGIHDQWNSRIFDYSNTETLRFLMSNLEYWVKEFRFDGFRFDGVTSMLYHHHGINYQFSGDYNEYFNEFLNIAAVNYMQLANEYLHDTYPGIVTIAEDVSGFPGLCRPVSEGGVGFDYRLAMSIPDMWIRLLKESTTDAEWDMAHIVFTLNNRRYKEKAISYVESHDQALVGDKTVAFWLMDKEMYTNMSVLSELTPVMDRGISLHKMLRLLTFALGGEGLLTFMGNEFGHPEWLDFPREGNGESYHYCRRQYNLPDDKMLRYKLLENWDGALLHAEEKFGWLDTPNGYIHLTHQSDKVIVFERGGLCFAFNFHWESYVGYQTAVPHPGMYKVVLDSDQGEFGGHSRVEPSARYFSYPEHDKVYIKTYLPSRTCLVFALSSEKGQS